MSDLFRHKVGDKYSFTIDDDSYSVKYYRYNEEVPIEQINNIHYSMAVHIHEQQQYIAELKQQVEQLERERDEADAEASELYDLAESLEVCSEYLKVNFANRKTHLAKRDIEQQEKGVNHVGVILTDMGFDGVESLCEKAIEQLRKGWSDENRNTKKRK